MGRNVFIAQSGGPSAVINNSMRGVIDAAMSSGKLGRIYAGQHGILGALQEKLLDVSAQAPEEIALLEVTPTAGTMGSCRYKLPKIDARTLEDRARGIDLASVDLAGLDAAVQDYVRVLQVFKSHDIGYFFYAGGNDSMETAHKLSLAARALGADLVCTGVPKTIDNDVGDSERKLVDHTPGYGSTACFWRDVVQSADEENRGSMTSDPVLLLQAMGRKVGYVPASARLADPDRLMPLAIIMTEMLENEAKGKTPEIAEKNRAVALRNLRVIEGHIERLLERHGRAVVVVSEGAYLGDLGFASDSFGHAEYSTGIPVVASLAAALNSKDGLLKRMKIRGSARFNVAGTDQRGSLTSVAAQDLLEAYESGRHAVAVALTGGGSMATIKRGDGPYAPIYDKVPLDVVASVDRSFPRDWIDTGAADVTDAFVAYATPLIRTDLRIERSFASVAQYLRERDQIRRESPQSVVVPIIDDHRRFARFQPSYVTPALPAYVPVGMR